ncbi:MAG TPA: methylenetetrahydrofolate reductase [NAD(P)H] [Phycisphaerae bacterium]|nr:methylenetetrahydrofolate reductase [NAD(P)H] [Phycisphaerae bacterium]HNU46493.1 methylenetetrahydrofolate reductase [NAD(P)H] [Phycisphaerae bacterium]
MRITQQFSPGRPTLSFEFFPPKDEIGFWDLYRTVESLKPLHPTYVSVTYGSGGSDRRQTLDLVTRIKSDIGIESMAHLTCMGATRAELGTVVDDLKRHGIENVLALRGDRPADQVPATPEADEFRYASELVAFIRARSDMCIAAACYPEGHPEAGSLTADLEHLLRKVDAGVDFLITQLFFDNRHFYRFRERALRAGIKVPIVAGIMPILSVKQIRRFTEMCGASIPPDLLNRIESVEDDAEAVRHLGMYHATQQCLQLIEQEAAGIHFYTLNRSTATRAIYQHIKAMVRPGGPAASPPVAQASGDMVKRGDAVPSPERIS